jgi:hypothetical protein
MFLIRIPNTLTFTLRSVMEYNYIQYTTRCSDVVRNITHRHTRMDESVLLYTPRKHTDPILHQIVKVNMGGKLHEDRVTPNYQPHIRLIWG